MVASGGPSTGQTCGLVLIFAVLLQSICVAITFLYFTNELQQAGLWRTVKLDLGGEEQGRLTLSFPEKKIIHPTTVTSIKIVVFPSL